MGDHDYFIRRSEIVKSSGRSAGDTNIASLTANELANSISSSKKNPYGQFPANVALNYITFKTGHKFKEFLDDVIKKHVGLKGPLKFNHQGYIVQAGIILANFQASRYDTLRIGIAILNDWDSNNCEGAVP